MVKIILRAVLWGVVSWLVLSILLFFGIGFYQGFVSKDLGAEIPAFAVTSLRYLVLLLSLGAAAAIFILEERKEKPFRHIVAEKEVVKKPPASIPVLAPAPAIPKVEKKIEFRGMTMPKVAEKEEPREPDKKAPEIIWPEEIRKEPKTFEPSFKPPEPKSQLSPIPPKPQMPPQPKPPMTTSLTPPPPTSPNPHPGVPGPQQQPPWNRT